ncbi:hypothetical protein DFJ77DRAFT_484127 [Powellomyces hirtus]|nr:hypothetical protein DFJ77DRAFT_484127 [Powellomyces hirtus]
MVSPLWLHRDFALVFTSRFLFQLGIATIQQFMQYWISDCVSTTFPPQRAVSVALLPLFILSPIAAFFLPPTNRKLTVYLSTCLMIITCLILISAHTFAFALLASAVFGAGYGPFLSTEFAMLMDVLPNQVDAAKDMSLWHSALVWPQIIALPIAGFIRDAGQSWGEGGDFPENMHCPGYMLIFAICIVYFVAGASVTKAIRGVV